MLPYMQLSLVHWSIVPSWYPFYDLSELVLHDYFPLSFELLLEQTIDSIVHQLVDSLIKIMVSARKPQRPPAVAKKPTCCER